MKTLIRGIVTVAGLIASLAQAAEPKRLLVVGATAALRHPPVENGERLLRLLAEKSRGETLCNIFAIDKTHPATKAWPTRLSVVDEFYQFRNFDRAKAYSLPDMDFEGEPLPVTRCKMHGKSRVFYPSMGHPDDVLLADTPSIDYGGQKVNSDEVSPPTKSICSKASAGHSASRAATASLDDAN